MGILSEEVLKALPVLGLWEETSLRWSDLMFVEAMIMQNAMRKLIDDHDVCCLIVHDSLIVPSSKASLAADIIRSSFESQTWRYPSSFFCLFKRPFKGDSRPSERPHNRMVGVLQKGTYAAS